MIVRRVSASCSVLCCFLQSPVSHALLAELYVVAFGCSPIYSHPLKQYRGGSEAVQRQRPFTGSDNSRVAGAMATLPCERARQTFFAE